MTPTDKFATAMSRLPLVAVLRGLHPDEALAVCTALVECGFQILEVPLNSPQPMHSIATLARAFPDALIGAGTVLTGAQVAQVHASGGQIVVSPNFNAEVVRTALQLNMVCIPGVTTCSEAFAALELGVHALKLFPAEMIPPAALKALRAVLPREALVLPVGGIAPDNIAAYRAAGASGFGIGSALFKPGMSAAQVAQAGRRFADAWHGTQQA